MPTCVQKNNPSISAGDITDKRRLQFESNATNILFQIHSTGSKQRNLLFSALFNTAKPNRHLLGYLNKVIYASSCLTVSFLNRSLSFFFSWISSCMSKKHNNLSINLDDIVDQNILVFDQLIIFFAIFVKKNFV